jgi:hypothetical protein
MNIVIRKDIQRAEHVPPLHRSDFHQPNVNLKVRRKNYFPPN